LIPLAEQVKKKDLDTGSVRVVSFITSEGQTMEKFDRKNWWWQNEAQGRSAC